MTQKTFEVAGTSTLNGVTKVRFANDYVGRFKILAKNGHDNIELIELGDKYTKEEICQVLMQHERFQNEDQQSAIAEFVVRNVKSTTKVEAAENAGVEMA
jgi:homogentisate 1,2-dioxygenase